MVEITSASSFKPINWNYALKSSRWEGLINFNKQANLPMQELDGLEWVHEGVYRTYSNKTQAN